MTLSDQKLKEFEDKFSDLVAGPSKTYGYPMNDDIKVWLQTAFEEVEGETKKNVFREVVEWAKEGKLSLRSGSWFVAGLEEMERLSTKPKEGEGK